MKCCFFLFISIVPLYAQAPDFSQLHYIEDQALLSSKRNTFFLPVSGTQLLSCFQELYNQAIERTKVSTVSIPKIIHQIWLGPKPLSKEYKQWQETIKQLHPNWEYKLWTDKDINQLALRNQRAYHEAHNYGERSDIVRYEILEQFGGVYLDIDIQCLQPLDYLNEHYDFYAGFEPLWAGTITCLSIGNAVIASRPRHPILHECINQIRHASCKVSMLTKQLRTVVGTGPVLFTQACYMHRDMIAQSGIILPSECFYPMPPFINTSFCAWRFCIHHWTHSWLDETKR